MKKLEVIFNAFLNNQIVCTDTRSIAAGCIYFALKGERFNGNEFAAKALELGASVVVVDEEVEALQNDSRVIVVEDSLRALQDLAKLYRKTFQFPVLAITGSNGKTTTKELIREVLSKKFKVYATEGNLNNHIGVPLSLLRVPKNCEFAIIEMGANHQGEIASYCEIALPDYGLITNIGKAHLEGFGGVPGIIKGKGELFDSLRERGKVAFVNIELPHLESMIKGMNYTAYGFEQDGMQIQLMKESPTISFIFKTGNSLVWQECETNLAGTYNLYNVASAIAVGRYFEVEMNLISDAITSYAPNNNRSQLWKSDNNEVILDAYNAN
ncbi:MAG: UDP-N-acetylmuramoyl-tripeptide--D-alanyl-D-alanine ligase, partial [Bacteroidota bacterium]